MRKIIARILALIVCVVAGVAIYFGMSRAYFHESINDFIQQGERFAQSQLVNPEDVEDNSSDGKFVRAIAVYFRSFQDLNNEMDAETNKMLGAFDQKNLKSAEAIRVNLEKMDEYRALVQRNTELMEKNAEALGVAVSKLDQEDLKVGNIQDLKRGIAEDAVFRKSVADIRKTIASYMYSALEFLSTRQQDLSFESNGAILFKNPADQKYFYDLMAVISQADNLLKTTMAQNRNDVRNNVADVKKAFNKL